MIGADEAKGVFGGLLQAGPYVLGAAGCYAAAMIVMKTWGGGPLWIMAGALGAASVGALWFEILALRLERLGVVYVSILLVEALLIALVATLGFGERFSTREAAGLAVMVAGAAIASS